MALELWHLKQMLFFPFYSYPNLQWITSHLLQAHLTLLATQTKVNIWKAQNTQQHLSEPKSLIIEQLSIIFLLSRGSHDVCVRSHLLLLLTTMVGIWKSGAHDTTAVILFPIERQVVVQNHMAPSLPLSSLGTLVTSKPCQNQALCSLGPLGLAQESIFSFRLASKIQIQTICKHFSA